MRTWGCCEGEVEEKVEAQPEVEREGKGGGRLLLKCLPFVSSWLTEQLSSEEEIVDKLSSLSSTRVFLLSGCASTSSFSPSSSTALSLCCAKVLFLLNDDVTNFLFPSSSSSSSSSSSPMLESPFTS